MSFPLYVPLLLAAILSQNGCRSLDLKFECPLADLPEPCECIPAFGNIFFRCRNLENVRQLSRSIQAMSGYGITAFEVSDSKITHIPYDLFSNSTVFRMKIKNTAMFYLFNRELTGGYSNISEISLERVTFEGGLDWSVLENLSQLRTVSASECGLGKVDDTMASLDLPSLETLLLPGNGIGQVHSFAFSKLTGLKSLQLRNNLVQTMQRTMFQYPRSGLQFLDLSYNKLSSLPADMFEGMPQLNSLILRGNTFSILEKSYMENVFPALFFFDVNENPLICDCELKWVLSENRPFHIFGDCSTREESSNKLLRDLLPDDFSMC